MHRVRKVQQGLSRKSDRDEGSQGVYRVSEGLLGLRILRQGMSEAGDRLFPGGGYRRKGQHFERDERGRYPALEHQPL